MNWLAAVIAFLGVWIAFNQWWLAQKRLKMDLFDRRWAVYSAYRNVTGSIFTKATPEPGDHETFRLGTAGSEWLFDQHVDKFLRDFWTTVGLIEMEAFVVNGNGPNEERVEAHKKQAKLRGELLAHARSADQMFAPYMHIDEPLVTWLAREAEALNGFVRVTWARLRQNTQKWLQSKTGN